jgi:hypothetical protein
MSRVLQARETFSPDGAQFFIWHQPPHAFCPLHCMTIVMAQQSNLRSDVACQHGPKG